MLPKTFLSKISVIFQGACFGADCGYVVDLPSTSLFLRGYLTYIFGEFSICFKRRSNLYLIIMCPKCGEVRFAKKSQKTAQCFKCGHRIPVDSAKTKILTKTNNTKEAITIVQEYKMQKKSRFEA
jgi:ribosomal protein L37AE/L43A